MNAVEPDNNNENYRIFVLGTRTRTIISNLLNPPKLLRNEKGIPRDWQGLAELCGISGELIPSISLDQDPTAKILRLWNGQSKGEATVNQLVNYLEELDRSDVVDDILPLIAEDLKEYIENGPSENIASFDLEADHCILTRDDANRVNEGLEPQRYDAFVLFAEDDIDFATELIETMEKNYDLKFCVKERDLVGGSSEHDAVIKLIAERCGRLIVILSPAFLQSNANKFFYSLAQSIAIEQRQRRIIPCIYKDCGKLPPELDCYFKLDYRRSGTFWNFWDRLRDSIRIPDKSRVKLSLPENSLFGGVDTLPVKNPVSRSASISEQCLSPAGLKPSLHNDTSAPRSLSPSVKFSNSLSNLPNTEVPGDDIVPSTSANSLGRYEERAAKKTFSLLKKIRSLVPKSKSEKNRSTDQQETDNPTEKSNKRKAAEKIESRNTTNKNQANEIVNQQEKKEKKKKFSFRINKKKIALTEAS